MRLNNFSLYNLAAPDVGTAGRLLFTLFLGAFDGMLTVLFIPNVSGTEKFGGKPFDELWQL